jgi:uncharacterized membrane protein YeaQ/YmgE (transglycosylase-associated protein family)
VWRQPISGIPLNRSGSNAALSFLGISLGGWIGYLIAGFIGACILIAIARAFSGGLQQRT